MNLRRLHRYSKATGLLTGAVDGAVDVDDIRGNTSDEIGHVEGVVDWQSQRVDLATGQLVDYQPPQPSPDYEWIHNDDHGNRVRRWVMRSDIADRQGRRHIARSEITALEATQARRVRELLIRLTGDERLIEVEAEIQKHRGDAHE